VVPLVAACSSSAPPAPEANLKRVDAVLRAFAADANAALPRVAQTEAQLEQRLDETTVRLLAQELVTLVDAHAGDAPARAALRTQAETAATQLGDLPYLKDLMATLPAAAATVRLELDQCAGMAFTCGTDCVDDVTGAATDKLALKGLKGVIDKVTGVPGGLIASSADLAMFLQTCAAGGACDPATFMRLARDVSIGLLATLGGLAAAEAGAPLLGLVISLEATGLAVLNIVADEGARLDCCSSYQLRSCTGKCPPPDQLCHFPASADGLSTGPAVACCAAGTCGACFFEVANACPAVSWCGDLCCGSGMLCPADVGMCVAPEGDGGAPDGPDAGVPDAAPADAAPPPPLSDGGADDAGDICCCDFRVSDDEWHCTHSYRTDNNALCYIPWPDCCTQPYTICE
jgi:hypothetical protein